MTTPVEDRPGDPEIGSLRLLAHSGDTSRVKLVDLAKFVDQQHRADFLEAISQLEAHSQKCIELSQAVGAGIMRKDYDRRAHDISDEFKRTMQVVAALIHDGLAAQRRKK
jgi:hypothetical protein